MMRKLFLLTLAAAMIFVGCQEKEQEAPVNPNEGGSTFELVAEIAQTKTTLDGLAVEWEEGDIIYMVTSDGTWGAPWSSENSNLETIAEFTYADSRFTSDATIADGEYVFKGMYAAASQKSYHRGASTTHKLEATQTQDCTNPTAHIKNNDALVGTFTATTPMAEPASMTMSHLYTLMQVNVKNTTGAAIEVTKFEMTAADADLAGVFYVDAFDTPSISTKSGASSTITVNVTGGTVANNESLPVYFVMAPLTDYSGDVTFKVTDASGNTYTKTVTLSDITFAAGKYNTTPYTISSADEVEPEPANVTWDLSINETSEVTSSKIAWTSAYAEMYCEKGTATTATNNYYGGDASNRTSTRFYKNSVLTIAPKTGYKITSVVFTATSTGYASALSGSSWTNASAEVSTTTVTVTPTDGTQPMTATIGGTCGFTSIVVYYAASEGGETPEPENKTLVSITVEDPQTEYTVGDSFVEPTVKATYDDASAATVTGATFSGYDLTSEGTQEVTVSYTEGEVTVTTTYEITVSAAEILVEDGTYVIAVKEDGKYYAASTDANSSRRAYVELSGYSSGDYVSNDSKIVWTITNSGAGITVSSGEQYWDAVKNGISLVESSSAAVVSVAKSETEGAYLLSADCGSDGVRYLSKNGTYGFGFYAESNKEDIYLIPATVVELPNLDAPVVTAELNGDEAGIDVSWTAVDNATSYVVSCTNQDDVTVTSGTAYSFTELAAGTYTITVTAKSENYNSATSAAVEVVVPSTEGEPVWTLVTDVNNLAVGDQVVIVASASNYALSTTQNGNNRGQASVTKNDNTITFGSDVQILTLENGTNTGSYAFNTGSGYLYAASSSKNYLRTETTLSANSSWTISITSAGVATVKANGTNSKNWMRYNSSSSIFSCYSTGQLDIAIYKLQ